MGVLRDPLVDTADLLPDVLANAVVLADPLGVPGQVDALRLGPAPDLLEVRYDRAPMNFSSSPVTITCSTRSDVENPSSVGCGATFPSVSSPITSSSYSPSVRSQSGSTCPRPMVPAGSCVAIRGLPARAWYSDGSESRVPSSGGRYRPLAGGSGSRGRDPAPERRARSDERVLRSSPALPSPR